MKNNEIKIGMSSSFNYDITEEIVSLFDILKDEFDNNEEKFSYLKELMGFKDWFNHHYENGLVDKVSSFFLFYFINHKQSR